MRQVLSKARRGVCIVCASHASPREQRFSCQPNGALCTSRHMTTPTYPQTHTPAPNRLHSHSRVRPLCSLTHTGAHNTNLRPRRYDGPTGQSGCSARCGASAAACPPCAPSTAPIGCVTWQSTCCAMPRSRASTRPPAASSASGFNHGTAASWPGVVDASCVRCV